MSPRFISNDKFQSKIILSCREQLMSNAVNDCLKNDCSVNEMRDHNSANNAITAGNNVTIFQKET